MSCIRVILRSTQEYIPVFKYIGHKIRMNSKIVQISEINELDNFKIITFL